jgi:predicted secreted Zn-dependent protease
MLRVMNAGQVIITVVALLTLGGATVGVFALRGDDEPLQGAQIPAAATATLTPATPPGAPAEPPPSPTPQVAAAPETLPDRTECDEIRGSPYRSASERDFFLQSCAEAPPPEPAVSAPSVTADVSDGCEENVQITTSRSDQTYDVTGTNIDEIADSLSANAPLIEGEPAYGLTEYSYGLDGSFCAGAASCGLGEIEIAAQVTVTLPNLTTFEQLSSDVAQVWSDYAGQVSLHEDRHVRILEEGLAEIKRQLLLIGQRTDCAAIDHEIDKLWNLAAGQLEQRQRAFHIADAQGRGGLVVQ